MKRTVILIVILSSVVCNSQITNIWEEEDLRSVLHDIAIQSKVNIVIDIEVDGVVSLNLSKVSLEEALETVLSPRGYNFKKIGDLYIIGSGDPETTMALMLSETEQVTTNRLAEEVFNLLAIDLQKYISVSENRLSITAPTKIMDRIKKDIVSIDSPRDQVAVEVKVYEARWNRKKAIGIDWSQILSFSNQGSILWENNTPLKYAGVLSAGLETSIQALVQEGDLRVKTQPKVVVIDGEKAVIDVTKEIYVNLHEALQPANNSFYYPTTRYKAEPIKTGVILTISPQVLREKNQILLKFSIEVSEIIDMAGKQKNLPIVARRTVESTLRLTSGETVFIGGLYQHLEQKRKSGIPILRSLPIFSKKEEDMKDTELVILLTPRNLRKNITLEMLTNISSDDFPEWFIEMLEDPNLVPPHLEKPLLEKMNSF